MEKDGGEFHQSRGEYNETLLDGHWKNCSNRGPKTSRVTLTLESDLDLNPRQLSSIAKKIPARGKIMSHTNIETSK